MRKERILNEIKEELVDKINQLTYENAEQTGKDIQGFFDVIAGLHNLPFNTQQQEDTEEPLVTTPEKPTEPTKDKEEPLPIIVEDGMIGKTFQFQRRLSGGIIPDLDNGYLLPEKMVRDMTLGDGDIVKIIGQRALEEQTQYTFEVIEKSNTINPDRMEISFCKVDIEAGEYVVKESLDGLIRLDEVPYTFILQNKDRQRLRLNKGDIVDVAYYYNNPSTVRVIWKHNIENNTKLTEEERKLYSEHRNEKNATTEKIEKEYPINLELFKNRKILIVGGENRHADYRKAFEVLPTQLEMMRGTEETKRLNAAIERADVVVIITGEAKHRASWRAVEHCKESEKPFDSTHENGIQSVLLCVEKAIKKGIEQELIEKVG